MVIKLWVVRVFGELGFLKIHGEYLIIISLASQARQLPLLLS